MNYSKWVPDWEVSVYWDHVIGSQEITSKYHDSCKKRLNRFNIRETYNIVMDIGGGAFGGVFYYRDIGTRKILIDPCGTIFKNKYNKIPKDVEIIDAYANHIPLSDNSIDCVLCFEALDHCNSVEELKQSIHEIRRTTCSGGDLFFTLPLRYRSHNGHMIAQENISIDELVNEFDWVNITKKTIEPIDDINDGHFINIQGIKR